MKSAGGKKEASGGHGEEKDNSEMEDYLKEAHGEHADTYTNKAVLKDTYYNMRSFRAYTYKYSPVKVASADWNEYYNKKTRRSYEPL